MYMDPRNRTSTKPAIREVIAEHHEWLVLWKNERQKIANQELKEDRRIVDLAKANGFGNASTEWRFNDDRPGLVRECLAYLDMMRK